MKKAILLLCTAALAGCGGAPVPPSGLVPPAKRCMVPPGALEQVRAGDDLVLKYATTIKSYKRETSKVRCLQKWARAVTKKS